MEKFFFSPLSSTKPIIVKSLGRNGTNCREIAAEFKDSSTCLRVITSDFIRFLRHIIASPLFSPLFQDKVLSNKTPKLDRSDGVKEMKEKASKRKLPFSAGANGDQKDSDSGKRILH